jgi:hypothetical protein
MDPDRNADVFRVGTIRSKLGTAMSVIIGVIIIIGPRFNDGELGQHSSVFIGLCHGGRSSINGVCL